MNVRVLWVLILSFLVGVFLHSLASLGLSFIGFVVFLAAALILLALIERTASHGAILVAIALFACAGGMARMEVAIVASSPMLDERLGSKVVLEGVVSNEPDAREASTRIPMRADTLIAKNGTTTVHAGVLLIAEALADVSYGDRVRAEGTLRAPEAFEIGEGREFNYSAFLAKDGIVYELAFAHVEAIGSGARNPLKAAAIFVKQKYLQGVALSLPEPHAGLAGGITAGDKRGLGEDLSRVFRTVSLTHIIVLSGYNIMIVVFGLGWLFARVHLGRWVEFFLGISIAAFFALMTGLASASVRAAAMASIAMVGSVTGRMYLASRALALVAFGMVLWNPYVLVFDVGFQLSIIATFGLIALSPLVAKRLTFVPEHFALREIAAATIATQLVVLPLLLYQSGMFPLYALPANLLVLVVVPWAMLFSAIAALGGLMLGPLSPIVGFPAYMLLSYMIGVAHLFAALPLSSVVIPAFSAWLLALVYGGFIGFVWLAQRYVRGGSTKAQRIIKNVGNSF